MNASTPKKFQRAVQILGLMIMFGLVVELVTLRWSHPTSFLVFLLVGGTLIVGGIVLYLLASLIYFERGLHQK